MILVSLPLKLVNETNAREHWRIRSKRAKLQRAAARMILNGKALLADRFVVLITRIGKRKLDSDNLQASAKHVRDGIADWLGIDDGSDLIDWRYAQRIAQEYGVEIQITAGGQE